MRNRKTAFPRLTEKQKEKFKELYLKGYSSTLIFKELGQNYRGDVWRASSPNERMRRYRIKLGLPKRGTGFYGIRADGKTRISDEEKRKRKHQKRIKCLQNRIKRYKKLISETEKELSTIRELT